MTQIDRKRVFNLGYFTWVEQQGVSLEEFTARAKQSFWDGLLRSRPGLGRHDRRVQRQERRDGKDRRADGITVTGAVPG